MNFNFFDYVNYNAVVTLTMFFISFFLLFLDKLTRGWLTKTFFSTERASLLNPLTYLRFFTHILGHSDFDHFSSNYLKILLLGPMIEEKYGSWNFLLMILITAFITGIYNFIKGNTRLKGASGIAFMLIVLSAFVNVTENKIPLTFILILLFYLIDEIRDLRKKDGISHEGHLIGALAGMVFGFISKNQSLIEFFSKLF